MSQNQPSERKPSEQAQAAMRQAEVRIKQMGIDIDVAIKVLILALVSGILAALLDAILGLPAGVLAFTFGGFVAVLNGASYAFFTGSYKLDGLVMSAVSGLVTMFVWYIVASILLGDPEFKDSAHDFLYKGWVDEYVNLPKAMIAGIVAGMLGFGWFALLRRLPKNLIPR